MDSLEQLTTMLRRFAQERGWPPLHTPKNLSAAVAGEAGELVAVLQWAEGTAPLTPAQREALGDEMADVLIYLVRLADVCGVDLLAAANGKVERNEHRFPPPSACTR